MSPDILLKDRWYIIQGHGNVSHKVKWYIMKCHEISHKVARDISSYNSTWYILPDHVIYYHTIARDTYFTRSRDISSYNSTWHILPDHVIYHTRSGDILWNATLYLIKCDISRNGMWYIMQCHVVKSRFQLFKKSNRKNKLH